MAEWLGRALQKLLQQFESARDLLQKLSPQVLRAFLCFLCRMKKLMRYFNQVGAIAACTIIISCFLTWISIPDLGIRVTGFLSEGTHFGKPGLMNAFMSGIALILFLVPRVWAKRMNLFFTGFNLAWAIRNFILLTTCHGGDCPVKETGIYIFLGASILQLVMAVFPHLPIPDETRQVQSDNKL